tara:strand:- start:59 stop:223 length:165 start_codon:yes stop_codon:yes gene_type:complete
MPFVKPSDKTTEKLRGWLIFNPNKPPRKPVEPTLEKLQKAAAERKKKLGEGKGR